MTEPAHVLDHVDVVAWLAAQRLEHAWPHVAPPRFRDATLDDLADVVRRPLSAWCDDPDRGNLVITGPVGSGKTHAAFAVLRRLFVDLGVSAKWMPVPDLLDSLRPDRGSSIGDYARYGVLALDDVGLEKSSEWTVEQLDRLLNARWLAKLPTIVTTNLEPAGLLEAVGERSYSRLRDGAVAVQLVADDHRRPAA